MAEVTAKDNILHQPLTKTTCYPITKHCTPKEFPKDIIIWLTIPQHPTAYRPLGNHTVIKVDNFIIIPELGIGGAIEARTQDILHPHTSYLLDTGYIISQSELDELPTDFYNSSLRYVLETKSDTQRDILAAHIGNAILRQNNIIAALAAQTCRINQQVTHNHKLES